ncbi:MAG: toprim domain-containing protein [Bacteroidota bacterium]
MSFDEYKQKIDLIDFAQREYGFRINPRKSTKRHVVLVGQDEFERIIVSRNQETGYYWYFNPHDAHDKGSIIDFVYQRVQSDWQQVRTVLDAYLSQPKTALEPSMLPPQKKGEEIPSFDLKPYTDLTYLLQRGLSEKTLRDPLFDQRIFNTLHIGKRGQQFVNTAFPCFNLDGDILGLEVKNANYTGHALNSRKSEACWMSRYEQLELPISDCVLTEGAIDALSFHQLFPPQGSRIYISSGGMVTEGQMHLIQQLINKLHPQQLILAMDNDLAGMRYNIQLLGRLRKQGQSYSFSSNLNLESQDWCKLTLEFATKSSELIRAAILGMWPQTDSVIVEPSPALSATSQIRFKHDRAHLQMVEDRLLRLRNHQNWIRIQRASRKDFNEDLGIL